MEIVTSRFGPIQLDPDDVIHFPTGLLGLEDCRDWILLGDRRHDAVAWLQGSRRADIALAVVSPRRFVPAYQIRVAPRELAPLELDDPKAAKVLAILGRAPHTLTLNLKAPLVINLDRCLGRQVVANGDLPIRFELGRDHPAFRRSA